MNTSLVLANGVAFSRKKAPSMIGIETGSGDRVKG